MRASLNALSGFNRLRLFSGLDKRLISSSSSGDTELNTAPVEFALVSKDNVTHMLVKLVKVFNHVPLTKCLVAERGLGILLIH